MTSILNDKTRGIKLLIENILCGNVILNSSGKSEEALDEFLDFQTNLKQWSIDYDDKTTDLDLTNKIFTMFLKGRIEGWITGLMEERKGFGYLKQDEVVYS